MNGELDYTDETSKYLNYDKKKHQLNITDIKSIISYLINHYEKFLLLLLAIGLVYIIEHINHFNTFLVLKSETSTNLKESHKKKKKT
jgi:hypothetical protein